MLLGLLPGLAVAVRIQTQLARHLGANHPSEDEARVFTTLGAAN